MSKCGSCKHKYEPVSKTQIILETVISKYKGADHKGLCSTLLKRITGTSAVPFMTNSCCYIDCYSPECIRMLADHIDNYKRCDDE